MRKLIHLSRDENNGKWACVEGIKYFKNYTAEHFTDEEAYMQSINYKGYEIHKRLHDDMRYKTIPAGTDMDALKNALTITLWEIFRFQTEIVSEHYSGEDFGSSIITRLTYCSASGEKAELFMVLEESLVLSAVSAMLDMPLTKLDKFVMNAGKELSLQIAQQLGTYYRRPSQYQLESIHFITPVQFRKTLYSESFDYSILLNTGHGYFAFCVRTAAQSFKKILPMYNDQIHLFTIHR